MKKFLLACIILIAVVLRFWQLGTVPVSPDWDEAALGYNAYSILHTGKDEYGTFLPRVLRSFDDYKPPLYAYLAIPSVAVFGLNIWAVRIPSAVMGTLAVIGTYFLIKELVSKRKDESKKKNAGRLLSYAPDTYGLISSFLLAISPWHLQFSRIAFEANTGVTLNIWGLYALVRGLKSLPWMLFSAFLFGVSLYAYHSERVFVPLLLILFIVLFGKDVFADKKKVVLGIIVGLVTVLPLLPVIFDKTSVTRLKGTSSLSDQTGLLMRSVKKLEDDAASGNKLGALFDNRRIVYAQTLFDGYISHFSLRWLFLTGDNDRHHAPDNGLLYLWELPFLLWGIYTVWSWKSPLSALFLGWVLIAPIAASPTSETPHAIRTLCVLPSLQFFTGVGLLELGLLLNALKRNKNRLLYGGGLALLVGFGAFALGNTVYYFHMYYAHLNNEYSKFWQYGYKQAVSYAQTHEGKYRKIVVSTSLEQPHMFFLFYTKYDPQKYLAEGGTASGGFKEVKNHFGKYEFRPITNWGRELHDGSVLYIGSPKELPASAMVISYLDGTDAIRISE